MISKGYLSGWRSRVITWLTVVALVSCQCACTAYEMAAVDGTTEILKNGAEPDWKVIPMKEVVASEEQFKGERVRLYLKNRNSDDIGTNVVVIKSVDSTYVYGWNQPAEYLEKRLVKIELHRVTKAEVYRARAGQGAAYGVWMAFIIPIIIIAVAWRFVFE